MTFGSRLREARKKKGYTQDELARIVGVAKTTLTGYEKDNREPNVLTIISLTKALDVTGDELLGLKTPVDSIRLTEREKRMVSAYRENPEMQAAVDKLLGLGSTSYEAFRETYIKENAMPYAAADGADQDLSEAVRLFDASSPRHNE